MNSTALRDLQADFRKIRPAVKLLTQVNIQYGGIILRSSLRAIIRFVQEIRP